MGRSAFLMAVAWSCVVLLDEHSWALIGLDEGIAWALLLPSVYLAGLAILRD